MAEGSTGNTIDYLTLKNATVGILVEATENDPSPTLTIRNSQIYNSSNTNLWARTAFVNAENTVFGNSGSVSLYCNLGGTYDFKHCTIANYWKSGFRTAPALLIDNFVETSTGETFSGNLTNTSFTNCIIDGNRSVELLLLTNGTNEFQFRFDHSALQFDDFRGDFEDNPIYDFSDTQRYSTIFLNINNDFEAPGENNFNTMMQSEGIDIGDPNTAALVPQDILGNDRTAVPDIGAYEFLTEN